MVTDAAGRRPRQGPPQRGCPTRYRVDEFGTITDDGLPVAFFERLRLLPVAARPATRAPQQSEFSRVASLGTEGRASAVTVLIAGGRAGAAGRPDLDDEARKFLAFADNRQDASLQAGHFNDFVLVGLVRSALYRAARRAGATTPTSRSPTRPRAARRRGARRRPRRTSPAQDTDDEPVPRKKIARALRESSAYRLWADLKRGWRITMPNLEQTGQLRLTYAGVDELAADDDAKWAGFGQPLAGADRETRTQLMHVLLDELRRNLCIESEYLTEEGYDGIKRASQDWLKVPWALTDETGTYSRHRLPGPRPRATPAFGGGPVSVRAGPVRALAAPPRPLPRSRASAQAGRRRRRHRGPAQGDGRRRPARPEVREPNQPHRLPGAGQPDRVACRATGESPRARPDPRQPAARAGSTRSSAGCTPKPPQALVGLEAREHTAQVEPAEPAGARGRRSATPSCRSCTARRRWSSAWTSRASTPSACATSRRPRPTTPSAPAGPAGPGSRRSSLTYCATGNAHDNYYFGRSQDMVAGAVAPPRLDLGNEDLVRAHAHAIWLVVMRPGPQGQHGRPARRRRCPTSRCAPRCRRRSEHRREPQRAPSHAVTDGAARPPPR